MTGENIKITGDFADINRKMYYALSAVNKDRNASGVADIHYPRYRIDYAEHVGNVRNADNSGFFREQRRKAVNAQMARFIYGKNLYGSLFPLAKHLPGHNVRMVLTFRNNYLVPFSHALLTEGKREKIDGCRCSGSEDNPGRLCADEISHLLPCILVFFRGL